MLLLFAYIKNKIKFTDWFNFWVISLCWCKDNVSVCIMYNTTEHMLSEVLKYLISLIQINDGDDSSLQFLNPLLVPQRGCAASLLQHISYCCCAYLHLWLSCCLCIELLIFFFVKSVVVFPSKKYHYLLFCNPFWFSLFTKRLSLEQKRGQAHTTRAVQSEPDVPTAQRRWQPPGGSGSPPGAVAPVSATPLLRAPAIGFRHTGSNEEGNNQILTQILSAAKCWWRNHCTSCTWEQSWCCSRPGRPHRAKNG